MKHRHILGLIILLVIGAGFVVGTTKWNGKPWRQKQGLDLAGGVRIVLRAETEQLPKGEKWTDERLQGVIRVMRNRVDAFGVSEPLIQPKGKDQVVIELPDIKDEDQAIKDLRSTARLELRHFRAVKDKRHPMAKYEMDVKRDENFNDVYSFRDAQGKDVPAKQIIDESPIIVTGEHLLPNAGANRSTTPPAEIFTHIEFDKQGTEDFANFTKRNRDELLAIVLEGKILSVPKIEDAILDGKAIIRGGFQTVEEAKRLADFLNAGALPVPLQVIQTEKVEATLGRDAVQQSWLAGIVGMAAVIAFMLLYYMLPGLIADVALAIYTLLSLAAFKLIPVTLTLPGIAAFILSIGMAVDANILIFERLKEELRTGKTLRAAIDAGFGRAFTSIFDSNVCTLLTCMVLGYYGTGPIRGFALVLSIGVLISMFTAITVTRTILHLLVNTRLGENPARFGVGRQWVTGVTGHQHDIVGRMWTWFAVSAILIIPGLFFLFGMHGLKPGIDFTGGLVMQPTFEQRVSKSAIAHVLESEGLKDSTIQQSTENPNTFFIRTKAVSHDKQVEIMDKLATDVGKFDAPRVENVGPTISKELTANAFKAVLLASLAIVLYLSVRFAIGGLANGFRFGVCAIIALLHDVALIVGAFAIFGYFLHWEISSLFVTALLTVIGFSNHDTIVIFDRIRENLRHRVKGESFDGLVNRSILQSFARSINTSVTVILTLVALLIFGAESTRQFVVALLIGIVTGTYSSIFNASQMLVLWQRLIEKRPVGQMAAETARQTTAASLKPIAEAETSAEPAGVASGGSDVEGTASKAKGPSASKKRKRRY